MISDCSFQLRQQTTRTESAMDMDASYAGSAPTYHMQLLCRAPHNIPVPDMATYYGQRASLGGLIISEGTVISTEARGYVGQAAPAGHAETASERQRGRRAGGHVNVSTTEEVASAATRKPTARGPGTNCGAGTQCH